MRGASMSLVDGVFGTNGLANPRLSGGRRSGSAVAELPENQYRRIVRAQERDLQARFGKGEKLSAEQTGQARAEFDRLYALKQARTAFLAQQIAQEDAGVPETATASAETDPGQAAVDAFRKIMSMTPEERLFELLLKKRGLTQEELDALPPEEREKIIAEIKEEIREKIEKKAASTGSADTQGAAAAQTAHAAQAGPKSGTSPQFSAAASAASTSQTEITKLAEQRSPTGKVGFEDLLILMARGRDYFNRLSGAPTDPDDGEPLLAQDEPKGRAPENPEI